MPKHFQLAHAFFSHTCLEAKPESCDSQICACPCHFDLPQELSHWLLSMTGVSILHLAFAYRRSPYYDPTFATAVQQHRLHPQDTT